MQSKLAVKLLTPNQVQGLKLRSTLLHQIYVENEMPKITGQWPTGGTESTQGATALQTSQLNHENFPTKLLLSYQMSSHLQEQSASIWCSYGTCSLCFCTWSTWSSTPGTVLYQGHRIGQGTVPWQSGR